jgi:hypothetical protein
MRRRWIQRGGRVICTTAALSPEDSDLPARMGRFLSRGRSPSPTVRAAARRGSTAPFRRADVLLSAAPLEDDGVLARRGTSAQQVGAVLNSI